MIDSLHETCQAAIDEAEFVKDLADQIQKLCTGHFGTMQGGTGEMPKEEPNIRDLLFQLQRHTSELARIIWEGHP